MEGDLIPSSAPLADLCGLLGIGVSDLAAVEGADTLAYSFPVDAQSAGHLDVSRVRAFVDHYGDAARVELRTGDLTEIVIEPGITEEAVAAFALQARSGGGPYVAIVHLDKTRLVERLVGTASPRTVRVFLFVESLRRALIRGIARFEADVWPDAPAPLVIAVLDSDIELTGPHLSVLGGHGLSGTRAAAEVAPVPHDFDAVIHGRDRYIGWDTNWVGGLTPWHFELTGTCDDDALHGLLRAQLIKLAILFTCDRARTRAGHPPPGEILVEYRGREHVAVIPIVERNPLDCTAVEAGAVLRAVDWCYERQGLHGQPDWVSDRLPFVQTRIAQALEPHPAEERLAVLTRAMPYLLEGIEWHWKAFIEGKVGEYLDHVKEVETVVSDTVAAFTGRTAALAKGLTEAMLAAIAVLIGSFIAGAFDSPFNAALFRIGVLTYGGYVLLFPGVVGLLASHSNLRSARAEFDIRIARFNETLYPDKVTQIVGNRVADAQSSFYRWVALVATAYVAVALAATVAAAYVPGLVGRDARSGKQPALATMGVSSSAQIASARAGYPADAG